MEHLIPQEWFVGLSQWVLLLITAVMAGVLIKGADWLVDAAAFWSTFCLFSFDSEVCSVSPSIS